MKKVLALLLAMVTVLCLCSACGSSSQTEAPAAAGEAPAEAAPAAPAEEPAAEDSAPAAEVSHDLVIGTIQGPGSVDPCGSTNLIGRQLVFDSLFVMNPATGEIEGQLAESWEYLDDCTLKVILKEGATFSNGEPVTAEDVLYSYERYITSNSQSSSYFKVYDFEASHAEDDRTVILVTYEPYGPGITNLLNRGIVCKSWCEGIENEDVWWDAPVGSGPYRIAENVSGSHAKYELREDYWDTANIPEAQTITVRSYAEALTMAIDFENGDLDACFQLDETDARRFQDSPAEGIALEIVPIHDTFMLCLPEYTPAFDDIRVRQAIAYAIDMNAVADVGMGILALPATSIIPEGVNYHIDVGQYEYNPDKAKALLDEAGFDYSQSFNVVLVQNATNQRICETIQYYLGAVGINMTVESCDLPTAIGHFMKNETDMSLKETTEGAPDLEPNRILDTMLETSTNGGVRITDPEFASYLNGALNTIDPDERADFYKQAQEWAYENCRSIPICNKAAAFAYHTDRIADFQTASVVYPNFRLVHFAG